MKGLTTKQRQPRVTLEGKLKLSFTLLLFIYSIVVSCIVGSVGPAICMGLSTIGDIFMMKRRNVFHNKNKGDFKFAVFSFGVSHLAYVTFMNTEAKDIIVTLMLIILFIYILVNYILGLNEKCSKALIIPFYAVVLILSAVNTGFFNTVALIGGILFFISDSFIGIFGIKKIDNLGTNLAVWVTYVPAQILMLTSFLI